MLWIGTIDYIALTNICDGAFSLGSVSWSMEKNPIVSFIQSQYVWAIKLRTSLKVFKTFMSASMRSEDKFMATFLFTEALEC